MANVREKFNDLQHEPMAKIETGWYFQALCGFLFRIDQNHLKN